MMGEGEGHVEVEEEETEEVQWANHYSSLHEILLVGEGDFSFSLSLATSFGSASSIVATSLDERDVVMKKYKKAESNLVELEKMGATLFHGVDAQTMKLHTDLKMRNFDRIIFNFPHVGFKGKEDEIRLINMHRKLVDVFFRNARCMLRPCGEIHVSHKTTFPFCEWKLEELASENSLVLNERADFRIEDYPGYSNKRGDGQRCDDPFPLRECSTFKFRIGKKAAPKMKAATSTTMWSLRATPSAYIPQREPTGLTIVVARNDDHPVGIGILPQTGFIGDVDGRHYITNVERIPGNFSRPPMMMMGIGNGNISRGRVFYTEDAHNSSGSSSTGHDFRRDFQSSLRNSFEVYMYGGAPGRTIEGYINYLEELHRSSILRSSWLRRMLLGPPPPERRGAAVGYNEPSFRDSLP